MKSIDKVTTCHYNSDRLSLYCHVHWRDVCRLYAAKALSERSSRTGRPAPVWPGKDGGRMPTERFYHLPEEKKEMIREAAIREFCRVPFEKASINKIVKNAEISRGSFYTYFQDKEDVLGYIYEDLTFHLQDFCKAELKENGGDIWELIPTLLEHTLKICQKDQLFAMAQRMNGHNTILDLLDKKICLGSHSTNQCLRMAGEGGAAGDDGQKGQQGKKILEIMEDQVYRFFQDMYGLTDTSKLKVSCFDEFRALFSTCIMIMVGALGCLMRMWSWR